MSLCSNPCSIAGGVIADRERKLLAGFWRPLGIAESDGDVNERDVLAATKEVR
jgi:hypothetical protein